MQYVRKKCRITAIVIGITLLSLNVLPGMSPIISIAAGPSIEVVQVSQSDIIPDDLIIQPGLSSEIAVHTPLLNSDIYVSAGLGMHYLQESRISETEFLKGYSLLYIQGGISTSLANTFSLDAVIRFNNAKYLHTNTYFAYISAGMIPEIVLIPSIPLFGKDVKAVMAIPILYDFRKDIANSLSVGMTFSIQMETGGSNET